MDLYHLEKEINKLWQKGIKDDGSHIFFNDIERTKMIINDFRNYIAKEFNIKSFPTTIQTCSSPLLKKYPSLKEKKQKKITWEKPLSNYDILQFDNFLKKEPEPASIYEMIHRIKNNPLPSSVNLNDYLEELDKSKKDKKIKNKKRFLVVGAGPNGLFIATILHHIFNQTVDGIEDVPQADILIIDNRITEEGFRQPYSRTRRFSYSSVLLNYLYKYLYCKNPNQGGPINYIEYLGYINAFSLGIPIYFTDKYNDKKKVMELIEKGGFDVLFDSSGGRLNLWEIKSKIPYSLNKDLPIEKDGFILEREGDNRIVFNSLIENNPFIKMFYLELFDKNENNIGYQDLMTLYTCDIELYSHFERQMITKNQFEKVVSLIKDPIDLKNIKNILEKKKYVKYLKLEPIPVKMNHLIKIAEVMKTKSGKEFLYLASGDTLFHSHFITGAGINRLFNFITRILYKF